MVVRVRLRAFKLVSAATGVVVVASGLVAAPAAAASSQFRLNGVVVPAVASEPVAGGDLEATPIPELSTETSTTTLLPSGEYEASIATTPINFVDEAGEWAPIDPTLVAPTADSDAPAPGQGGVPVEEVAAENAAAAHTLSIPEDAAVTPLRIAAPAEDAPGGEAWVTMAMEGLAGAPVVEENTATFDQVEGADAVELQSTSTGLKETIVLEQPPAAGGTGEAGQAGEVLEYRYRIQTSAGLVPRLSDSGAVEFVPAGASGSPVAGAEPVFTIPVGNMFDSAETTTVDGEPSQGPAYTNDVAYTLTPASAADEPNTNGSDAAGWDFTLTPDLDWLNDPARVYPVMIDPDIQLVTNSQARDCSLWQDQPNSIRCGDNATHLHAGRVSSGTTRRRSVLYFNAFGGSNTNPNGQVIPADAEITHGNVQLWLDPSQTVNGNETAYVMNRVSKPFTNGATWNSPDNRPSANPWGNTQVGGGPTGADSESNRLSGNEPSAWRYFNIDAIARGWHAGTFPNNGVVLKQKSETVSSQIAFFSSSANNFTNRHPKLNIRYRPVPEKIDASAGERDFWEFEERELNDRMTAMVNIGNGNLLLKNQDTTVAGRAGWDMSWMRYYNSTRRNTGGSLGAGWSHGFGGEGSVQLDFPDNNATDRSKVRFWGPSGYRTVFNRDGNDNSYTREKPGIKAHLDYQPNNNRYQLRWFDESKYYFSNAGRLTSTEDKNGNKLTMTYRADGRLGSVTDTRNRVLFFTYNVDNNGTNTGLIDTAEVRAPGPAGDPTGGQPLLRWKYEYTQPTGQIARLASARVQAYNEDGALAATARDEDVNSGGNINATTTYEYNNDGTLNAVTDARGSLTAFTYDDNTPRVETMTRVHGTESNPSQRDASKDSTTTFTYFPTAFPPNGSSDDCKNQGDDDASFRTHIDGERLPGDSDDVTRYCIDSNGRILRTTDARDNIRSTTWTDNSNVDEADLSGTGTGEEMWDYSYDAEDENAEGAESPEGATTGADYDSGSEHNPAAVQGDDSGGEQDSWRYKYDDNDNLIRARSGIDPTAPNGERRLDITYEYCWTADGQIARIMPGDGDGNPDNDGDATSSGTDDVNCSPGSQGDDTIHTYNGQGELTNVNRPAGGDLEFTYDALSRIRTVTDGKGTQTSYCYDAMDRITRAVHQPSGQQPTSCEQTTPPQGSETVTWDYDLSGNTTEIGNLVNPEVTTAPIPTKTFTYDRLNRLRTETPQNPSSKTEYFYDPAGNVVEIEVQSEMDAGLESTKYSYNPVNMLLTLNDQRPGDQVVTFDYDDRDNRTKTIYPITNADGTANSNKLVHEARYNKDSNVTCMFSYRQTGGPTTGTACDQVKDHPRLITYRGYDYKNPELGDRVTSTKYRQTDLGNRTTRYAYDAIKRLTRATTRDGGSTNDTILRDFEYEYSKRSNITNEWVAGTTPSLETGRLQMAYNNGDEICASVRQQDNAPNLDCDPSTTVPGQTTYTHDATGNMLGATGGGSQSMGGLGLEYNLPRQTTSITPPGGGTSPTSGAQAYDGVEQDRRTAAGDTVMSYGYAGQVTAQNTGGSTPAGQIFVRDPAGDLIAMLSRDPNNPGTITDVDYYLLDDQKTVMATHDGRGNLTGDGLIRYLYEPYGQIIRAWTQDNAGTPTPGGNNPGDDSQDGDAPAPNTDNNPFTYVSGYHDRATGLIKYGTRYYIPELGTWTQPDPQNGSRQAPLTLNKYSYATGNPISNTDASGRFVVAATAAVGAGLFAYNAFMTSRDALAGDANAVAGSIAGEAAGAFASSACVAGTAGAGAVAAPICLGVGEAYSWGVSTAVEGVLDSF